MACRHAGPHRDVARRKIAHPVHANDPFDRKLRVRFPDDSPTLGLGKFDVRLIRKPVHRAAVVVVAHTPLEAHDRACTVRFQPAMQAHDIDGCLVDREHPQPPLTGGRNTTSSLSASRWFQSVKAPLTATRRRSGVNVNPCRAASSAYRALTSRASLATCSSARPAASHKDAKYSSR